MPGTSPAADALVETHVAVAISRARTWIRRMSVPGVDRDDVMSAAMYGLLKAAHTFDMARCVDFKPWLYRRIDAEIIDEFRDRTGCRRQVKTIYISLEEFERVERLYSTEVSPEEAMISDSEHRAKLERINGLPPRLRRVVLKRISGKMMAQIADEEGVTESRICQLIHRAQQLLKPVVM